MTDAGTTRRTFVIDSLLAVGGIGLSASPLRASARGFAGPSHPLDRLFPRYEAFNPAVPVWCVTPSIDRVIHRFHLTSPFSPSGRYLGLTRLSREDRPPAPGESADIVLVDLKTGTQQIIAQTKGWDTQLGAQVQWGASDKELFFNDNDPSTWIPFGVKMDPRGGRTQKLEWTVYAVSPDGKWAASPCLRRISATQAGYGVIVPTANVPQNTGAADDDGVYVTDTATGRTRLIASFKRIVEEAVPKIDVSRYGPGDFYGFHVKWNARSDRLFLVLRYLPHRDKQYKPMLVTMTGDGRDIRLAVPSQEWADKGGNHPNWHPDGDRVFMNLNIDRNGWRFVTARYDGTGLTKLTDVPASQGHPSIHRKGRFLITDSYATEKEFGDGTSPLWFIDLATGEKRTLVRVKNVTPLFDKDPGKAQEMRVDLHPAWDTQTNTLVAFNGVDKGTRRVFVADLRSLLG
jgi:hypothetical protein